MEKIREEQTDLFYELIKIFYYVQKEGEYM